ncbi:MAG: heavy metal-binding domain-containing protein [Chthoniobacterales bacterium]
MIQKANERLAGNAPVEPQYQASEMENMPGMRHDVQGTHHGVNMNGEQKPGARSYWTCVMHPQVKQDKPGKCPICGMTLVEQKAGW